MSTAEYVIRLILAGFSFMAGAALIGSLVAEGRGQFVAIVMVVVGTTGAAVIVGRQYWRDHG